MNSKLTVRPYLFNIVGISALFIVWVSIYLLGLNQIAIIDPSEGYYAEAAREMLESGNWIVPHLNYQIYFSKPILTFWLIASAYKLFGVSEFSTRIMFALLILLLLAAVFQLARRIDGTRCAIFSTIICATAPLMMAVSRLSPIDIAFTCFLNLALFSWIQTYIFARQKYWMAFYASLGLAVLTKGPAGIVVVLLGLFVYALVELIAKKYYKSDFLLQKLLTSLSFKHLFWGVFIFLVIVLPWYIAVGIATHGLFLRVFFLYENLARFAGHTNLSKGHLYNYLPVLAYGFAPWIIFLLPAIKSVIGRYQQNNLNNDTDAGKALLCLLCFTISFFALISLSKTQLDTYLLPLIAPISILTGYYLNQALEASSTRTFFALKLISLLFAIAGLAGSIVLIVLLALKMPLGYKVILILLLPIFSIGYISQYWLLLKGKLKASLYLLFATTAIISSCSFHFAFHIFNRANQANLKKLCLRYKDSKDELCIFHAFKPSVMFYTKRPVETFFHPQQLIINNKKTAADTTKLLILAHSRSLPVLTAIPDLRLQPIDKQGAWYMLLASNADLQKGQTLSEIFKDRESFKRAMKGVSDTGPLTVPYTAGPLFNHK